MYLEVVGKGISLPINTFCNESFKEFESPLLIEKKKAKATVPLARSSVTVNVVLLFKNANIALSQKSGAYSPSPPLFLLVQEQLHRTRLS